MLCFLYCVFFFLGTCIGSFLNVIALRHNTEHTYHSRSACPHCGTTLQWFELVPIFSYIAQLGRCRTCRGLISIRYLLVEIFLGLLFSALLFRFFSPIYLFQVDIVIAFVFAVVTFSILALLVLYDVSHLELPGNILLTFVVASISSVYLFHIDIFNTEILRHFLLGMTIAIPFLVLAFFSREKWIGYGDGILLLGIGALLGLIKGLFAIALASWLALVVYFPFILFKKQKNKLKIPFVAFLAVATIVMFVFPLDQFFF